MGDWKMTTQNKIIEEVLREFEAKMINGDFYTFEDGNKWIIQKALSKQKSEIIEIIEKLDIGIGLFWKQELLRQIEEKK
jgi:hypothetical protein